MTNTSLARYFTLLYAVTSGLLIGILDGAGVTTPTETKAFFAIAVIVYAVEQAREAITKLRLHVNTGACAR